MKEELEIRARLLVAAVRESVVGVFKKVTRRNG